MLKKLLNNKNITIIFFLIWFLIFISLSLLRDSISDENIYLGNSVEIANIIQRGEWIGNYGIGLHGFLNKLLLGIVFIFTGPSVFIATLLNIKVFAENVKDNEDLRFLQKYNLYAVSK